MFTAYPQLIHMGVMILTLAANCSILLILLRRFARFRDMQRDVEATKLDIGDLTDRFVHFQRREGMRQARETPKKSDADLLAELQTSVKPPPAADPAQRKIALRRKLRTIQ